MFREMRRKGQQISAKECAEILSNAKSGVLGLHGDDGYPYTVPVSFVYTPGPGIQEEGAQTEGVKAEQLPAGTLGTIGFHCAKTGHKIDAIRRNEKVSFTVVAMDEIMPKSARRNSAASSFSERPGSWRGTRISAARPMRSAPSIPRGMKTSTRKRRKTRSAEEPFAVWKSRSTT